MKYLWLWLLLMQVAYANPMLHQEGTHLVGGDGRPVYLRGVNLGGWLNWEGWLYGDGVLTSNSQILTRLERCVGAETTRWFQQAMFDTFVTEDDFAAIERLGFNSVRLPINYRVLRDPDGWKRLDDAVAWGERHHVYVILDLHAAPGAQSRAPTADPATNRTLWQTPSDQEATVALWQAVARRYKARTGVGGYDLLNEPIAPSSGALMDLYRRIATAIRAEDAQHLIFLEGNNLASDFSGFTAPCDNVAYSFHMYTWLADNRRRRLADLRKLSEQQQVPLWCGEFGENKVPMIASTVQMYEDRGSGVSGWAFWTWKRAPSVHPGLMVVTPPPQWMTVMHWVAAPAFKPVPQAEAAQQAMRNFVEACRVGNCILNPDMLRALVSH